MGERLEPHTDPMLPVITDAMLPPLERPRVPTLDDRALAEMLAELDPDPPLPTPRTGCDGGDAGGGSEGGARPEPAAPSEAAEEKWPPAARARPLELTAAGEEQPAITRDGPPSAPGRARSAGPATGSVAVSAPADPEGGPPPTGDGPGGAPAARRPMADSSASRGAAWGRRPPHPVGPPRPEARPSVAPAEESVDLPLLTELSRHSYGKVGSRVFTAIFVAIFLLILLQAVIGVLSA